MIDLAQEYDSPLVKNAGLHINSALDSLERLEFFARANDEAGALAASHKAIAALQRVVDMTAIEVLRERD